MVIHLGLNENLANSEAMLSRHDWSIVDFDIKSQLKNTCVDWWGLFLFVYTHSFYSILWFRKWVMKKYFVWSHPGNATIMNHRHSNG